MNTIDNASFSLKGKVIVVTGGTGVLGYAMIKGIVANGGTVGILGRKKQIAEERAHDIINAGGRAIPLVADVMNEAQLEVAKKEVLDAYGRIDGLLNAAGGNLPEGILMPDDDIFDMNIEGMKRAMELNVWGTVIPTKI
ncbi:MAG: SDR family NAD(P)-dependent oxidoreductase, partial [Bacteroidota bacterium]